MQRCNAVPYEGNDPYVFVSYCHKDSKRVYPVIEALARQGFRIWYDEGINPGTEWPEVIAEHLNSSTMFISFVSEESLNSHNCRKEFNYAVLKRKSSLTVILEPVQMSLGMELQMATIQAVLRYQCRNFRDFVSKISGAPAMSSCLGAPQPEIRVAEEEVQEPVVESVAEPVKEPVAEPVQVSVKETVAEEVQELVDKPKKKAKHLIYVLTRKNNQEKIPIIHTGFRIGRKKEFCDYAVEDNRVISKVHAIFYIETGKCFVMDNQSLNHVFVNEKQISVGEKCALQEGDSIRLANEIFLLSTEEMEES